MVWHCFTVLGVTSGLWRSLCQPSLKGEICASLHVLVDFTLLSVQGIFMCLVLFFPGSSPLSLHFSLIYSLFFIYPVGSPQFFQFSVMGARVGPGTESFWRMGLMAKLLLGQALKCSSYCIWVSGHHIPAPHVPGHPISIFDEGVKLVFFFFTLPKQSTCQNPCMLL